MRRALVPATFLLALGLRGRGAADLPPTVAEASGAWAGIFGAAGGFDGGRLVAAVAGAVTVALLTLAFLRRDPSPAGTARAAAVGGLALLDPLGLVVGREAGPGALLGLSASFLVLLAVAPPRGRAGRAALGLLAALAAAAAWPAHTELVRALPADATVTTWRDLLGAGPGGALLLLHHLGYALVPLAAAGLARRSAGWLVLLAAAGVAAGLAVDGGALHRLTSFGAVSPPVLALAGLALGRFTAGAAPARTLAGVVLLVAAVNAPVFVSDLRGAQRFPWPLALRELPDGTTPLWTTTPAPLSHDTDREVRALPEDPAALEARLAAGDLTILVPVEGGRAYGARTDDLLAIIERRRLAAFEVRVRRFDLYRFEVRAFIFPPRP